MQNHEKPQIEIDAPPGMVFIPGGTFTMGSDMFYPEEAPKQACRIDGFFIDETPVTNRQFGEFVAATGHVTFAELAPDPRDYPGMLPAMAHPGSAVFKKTPTPVDTNDPSQWWDFVFGANWRHPLGPDSTIEGMEDHPVVHVAWRDVEAYAKWSGKVLPTEAEWEYAARSGREGSEFAWGDELMPQGRILANFWHGLFPFSNTQEDGWERTSPVRSFAPNDYGVYDMIGNVWEWTADWYGLRKTERKAKGRCCIPANPRGARQHDSFDQQSAARIPRKVLKGGSHLCAPNYCQRYRPAARHPEPIDTSTSHVGFRCIKRIPA